MTLVERAEKMMDELGIPISNFCRRAKIGRSSWYGLKTGIRKLSKEKQAGIEQFLARYGF